MPIFSKRFTNYFYKFQTSEKYIYQILQKLKKNKIHTRRWERRDCRRMFHALVRVWGRDTGTGMIACLTLKPSGRTHRDASHARTHAPAWSQAGGGRPFRVARPKKRLITTGKSTGWSLAFLKNFQNAFVEAAGNNRRLYTCIFRGGSIWRPR